MGIIKREKFIERILSNKTGEAFIANRLHSVLQSCNSAFQHTTVWDFLQNKELFDAAKHEMYDILIDEHQKAFDIAERILWGNRTKEKKAKEFSERFTSLQTNKIFKWLKKLAQGDYSDTNFVVTREHILSVMDEEYPDAKVRDNLDYKVFEKLNLREKASLIMMALKLYLKTAGIPLFPEYINRRDNQQPQHSSCDGNMNTIATVMWLPFDESWMQEFSKLSIDLMVRLDTDYLNVLMYHFDLDTPQKFNALMERFKPYEQSCKENGATLERELGEQQSWESHENMNQFVEYINDSFWKSTWLAAHLEFFQINTLEEFEKLFPYGIIHGKLHRWNSELSWKQLNNIYNLFGIYDVDKYVELLSFENKKFFEILEIGKNTEIEDLEEMFTFFWCTTQEECFSLLKEEDFEKTIKMYKKHINIFQKYDLKIDQTIPRKEYILQTLKILSLIDDQRENIKTIIKTIENEETVTEDNWLYMIIWYACANDQNQNFNFYFPAKTKEKLNKAFEGIEAKDLVYDHICNIFSRILHDQEKEISYKELALVKVLNHHGIGIMSSSTLLVNITESVWDLSKNEKTPQHTKDETINNINILEEKIKNRPKTDKSDLYGSINNILKVSPAINTLCLDIFNGLSERELKYFAKDTLPILVSWILLLKKQINKNPYEDPKYGYDPKDLVEIHSFVKTIANKIKSKNTIQESGDEIKTEILHSMQKRIKQQFWLKELPIEKIENDMTTIQNYLTFIANIYHQSRTNNEILWLFFGLHINDLRQDFKSGKEIDFEKIFDEKKLRTLQEYLKKRKNHDVFASYDPEMRFKIQQDTIGQTIGNATTIDTKLASLNENIKDLLDPDNFPDMQDILELLLTHEKKVWAVLALSFQWKEITWDLSVIKEALEDKFWTLDKDKIGNIQTIVKHISAIVNFVKSIEKMDLLQKIETLDTNKKPTAELVAIFNKLWEKFSTESGIIPVNNDVEYLKEIIQANPTTINKTEKNQALQYIWKVEKQVKELYEEKESLTQLFINMKNSLSWYKNTLIADRIGNIQEDLSPKTSESKTINITTKMTSDMNVIIPNIRWCLWCMQKEINNHHNLTFGDSNKFFMAIYGEDHKKSIADCIVDVFPYNKEDEKIVNHKEENANQKKAFIIERVYGERNPDILLSIIQTIRKKQQESDIKDIDILVSNQALNSCHTKTHDLEKKLKEDGANIEEIISMVDILPSPSEKGHYEFADNTEGVIWWKVKTSGILISAK